MIVKGRSYLIFNKETIYNNYDNSDSTRVCLLQRRGRLNVNLIELVLLIHISQQIHFGSQVGSSTRSEVQGEFLWLNLGDIFRPQILSSLHFTVCDSFVLVDGDRSSRVFYAEWRATSLLQRLLFITA